MYLSSQKVISLLILSSPVKFPPVQQTPDSNSGVGTIQDQNQISDVEYGYKGPGVYHITSSNDLFNLALDNNGSGNGDPVVVWKSNDTESQRWFISEVGSGYVTVANNGTGVLLSAENSQAPTHTYFSSPGKLGTHWRIDNYSSINNPANAVRLTSAKFPTNVLAVYQRVSGVNGTIVYNWPSWGQYLNEAWLLEYLAA